MSNEIISKVSGLIMPLEAEFNSVISDAAIEFKREAEFAMQCFNDNSFLASTALRNKQSVRNAVMNVAAIGITLNPAQKLAYLVPRDSKVCLDISYQGLMHIAQQSGAVQWVQSAIVRANDSFKRTSIDKAPIHEYSDFAPEEERGLIVGAYCVVKTDTGDYLTHTMRISDILAIRDRSMAWKSYANGKAKSCPWATDEEQMILKTVVKQASKYWPKRERLDKAIDYINTEAGEGIDFADQDPVSEVKNVNLTKETQNRLNNALIAIDGSWTDVFLEFVSKLFGREITSPDELTDLEGVRLSEMLEAKSKNVKQ